ncbi:hypothetical protein [Polaromonas naphthalenivorans]|uniref:Uncharacterized protein n=1 Tax=Polaromonas naphthalenivorans (strain CJ2) TaxID=365044 RepID=A1VWC4_POLNA|nr:hypothetical protein [Polaromonas naphthalenivorans]ABM39952.1 hypothetical protein Pnap_4888 [Polaromonas naphthalenivorans CJ2]
MPSTTFCPTSVSAPQLSSVLRKRGKTPTTVDFLKLAKAAAWFDTDEEACETLQNAGFTCTPRVVEKLLSASKFIWMTCANQAHDIFLKSLGDAPQLTCRLPRLRNRTGRCYELAYRGCCQGNKWTVIHGETIGPHGIGRMGHAWLENNGWVYDPVLDRTMHSDVYVLLVGVLVFKRFTVWEMHNEAAKCGHYGPW